MQNNTAAAVRCQAETHAENQQTENLSDKTESGQERPWKPKKTDCMSLSDGYNRLSIKHSSLMYKRYAFRIKHCGDLLTFKRFKDDNALKLHKANFCKHRLCPMCAWRKSLKNYSIASKVMQAARDEGYKFLFLTLTLQNVPGDQLKAEITRFMRAWDLLRKDRTVDKAVRGGWIRTLEVTRNAKTGTYNPHIHAILAIRPSYFKGGNYIKQSRWQELWRAKTGVDYDPIINIQTVSAKKSKSKSDKGAIKEISKYAVKSGDMLVAASQDETDRVVETLDDALFKRRLTAYGGRLKKIKAGLNVDEKDLVNTDTGEVDLDEDLAYVIEKYAWSQSQGNYIRVA